jgi:hypothetical protein
MESGFAGNAVCRSNYVTIFAFNTPNIGFFKISEHDPLHLIERYLIIAAVV